MNENEMPNHNPEDPARREPFVSENRDMGNDYPGESLRREAYTSENGERESGQSQPSTPSWSSSPDNNPEISRSAEFQGLPGENISDSDKESAVSSLPVSPKEEGETATPPHQPSRLFRAGAFVLGLLLMAGTFFAVYRALFSPATRMNLTLYFSNFARTRLVPVKRTVPLLKGRAVILKKVIQELCYGPISNDTLPSIPSGTKLHAVWIKGDTAYVDLSRQLYLGLSVQGGSEIVAAYSLVQTAVDNVPGIKKVQILVNGNPLPVLRGLVCLSSPLVPRDDLIFRSIRKQ